MQLKFVKMKPVKRSYEKLTALCQELGMEPYIPYVGAEGLYTIKGLIAPVDLSACAETKEAILKTALRQLSEKVSEQYFSTI